jgi:DNA (cytosine-5)-methyltransferase 1
LKRKSRSPSVISLYTGVGGLDFGFEAAGFHTRVAVELDAVACRTIRANQQWPVLEGDIHNIGSDEILQAASLDVGEADALIGGPPCQPFSKSGYWSTGDARRLDDPRSGTLQQYLRVLKDTLPKTFLLENVHGLTFKEKDEGLQLLLSGIDAINRETGSNYRVHMKVLNAASFGVPQLRERVFLIGSRDGAAFSFPLPTHALPNEQAVGLLPPATAWDAIGDLPKRPLDPPTKVTGKWAELLPSIPEGQNYLWHTDRGGGRPLFGWRTRYWNFLLKLAKNQPSWTIQAQPGSSTGPFHWANRKLTVQELCRLQTFPEGLTFNCGRTDAQKLIGNAVPSLLAEVLARAMRKQLLGHVRVASKPQLFVERRSDLPAPERVQKVPEAFEHLVGEHEAHPGEGLGRGAVAARRAG